MRKKPKPPLNAKQARFVAEYRICLSATEAAKRAGYSPNTAHSCGPRLLEHAGVKAALADVTARQMEKSELTATRTLEEMRRLAFSNVQDLFDEHGDMRPIQELTREQAACIASIEVVMKNATAGDGKVDRILKVKTWDKPKVIEMLGKHFALLVDRVRVEGDDVLIKALHEGRARAAKAKK